MKIETKVIEVQGDDLSPIVRAISLGWDIAGTFVNRRGMNVVLRRRIRWWHRFRSPAETVQKAPSGTAIYRH